MSAVCAIVLRSTRQRSRLLDRLPLADVEQRHRGSILAVFEAERGNHSGVLGDWWRTFAFK